MKIIIHNEQNAEDNAMLQALYSRSSASVEDHITKLKNVGSGKFMEQYYLNYGHASIADCGFTTIYFEGVSMLCAKAIQDEYLYNGQECSSRYIDFSQPPFQDFGNPYVAAVQAKLRKFYVDNLPKVKAHVAAQYPKKEDEKESVYNNTVNARAFDILRGFLPCGATTNLSWTTSLRKAHEHLVLLMHHPLEEVRGVAFEAYSALYEKYPHSFERKLAEISKHSSPLKRDLNLLGVEGEVLYEHYSNYQNFYDEGFMGPQYIRGFEKFEVCKPYRTETYIHDIGILDTNMHNLELEKRPRSSPVLRKHSGLGYALHVEACLDFGSFRDLQRHRGGYCNMPVVSITNGFHPWYYDQLPADVKKEADVLFEFLGKAYVGEFNEISSHLGEIEYSPKSQEKIYNEFVLGFQYALPMGTMVNVNLGYSIQQAIYVSELRSGKTVHATLRPVAQAMSKFLTENGVFNHANLEEDNWSTKRGTQTIVEKQ